MEVPYLIFYMIVGWVIGFIGGMVGLVLGTIRYPFIFGAENMTSVTAGTNLAISTLAAITASIRHYKNNNIDFNIFLIMAISGAFGAILGTFLTKLIPLSVLLCIIVIIVSYEAVDLLRKSRNS